MQSFRKTAAPLFEEYNRWLNGAYMHDLNKFKGGWYAGTDYVSRVFRARNHEIE